MEVCIPQPKPKHSPTRNLIRLKAMIINSKNGNVIIKLVRALRENAFRRVLTASSRELTVVVGNFLSGF